MNNPKVKLCYGQDNKCRSMGYVAAKIKTNSGKLKTIRYCKAHAAEKGAPILW